MIVATRQRPADREAQASPCRVACHRGNSPQTHAPRPLISPEHRLAAVRVILSASPEATHVELSEQTGVSPETVRRIRYGISWRDVLPDLPRQPAQLIGASCRSCELFDDGERFRCSLLIPEAFNADGDAQLRYASECSTYLPRPEQASKAAAKAEKERLVLELLAQGMTKNAVQRQLGASQSFVRRVTERHREQEG